jgi:hypothetical protein
LFNAAGWRPCCAVLLKYPKTKITPDYYYLIDCFGIDFEKKMVIIDF